MIGRLWHATAVFCTSIVWHSAFLCCPYTHWCLAQVHRLSVESIQTAVIGTMARESWFSQVHVWRLCCLLDVVLYSIQARTGCIWARSRASHRTVSNFFLPMYSMMVSIVQNLNSMNLQWAFSRGGGECVLAGINHTYVTYLYVYTIGWQILLTWHNGNDL